MIEDLESYEDFLIEKGIPQIIEMADRLEKSIFPFFDRENWIRKVMDEAPKDTWVYELKKVLKKRGMSLNIGCQNTNDTVKRVK